MNRRRARGKRRPGKHRARRAKLADARPFR